MNALSIKNERMDIIMTTFQALILGIIQGLTELLPISSSGHLDIIPWLFNWTNNPNFVADFEGFDVALHFGTFLAIGIFFFKDWIKLIVGGFNQVVKKKKTTEGRMFWYLVIATIPGGIIGLLLDTFVGDALKQPVIIAIALIVMGIILYVVDKKAKSTTDYEHMSFKQTFLIGLSQCLAFIPGVSRSGITMTTGRAMGVDRKSTAKYSFMLSAPIVFAATLFKIKDFVFSVPFFVGILASFIVGLIVIKWLLQYLQKGSFKGFAIYRVIFGIIILIVAFVRG